MRSLLKPIISEKSLTLVESSNEYTFQAPRHATKHQIKEVVEKLFSFKALSVRTKVLHGKTKRAGRLRRIVEKPDGKQVIVRLAKKDKIDLFEVKEKSMKSTKSTKG